MVGVFHGAEGEEVSWQRMTLFGFAFCWLDTTLLYPLELLKTIVQLRPDSTTAASASTSATNTTTTTSLQKMPAHKEYLSVARRIWREQGLRGFYRGYFIWAGGGIPSQMLYFASINYMDTTMKPLEAMGFAPSTWTRIGNESIAALTADVVSMAVWTPFDVLGQRLMIQNPNQPNSVRYRNGRDAIMKVWQQEGLKGFYRGFGASLLASAPTSILWYVSYEQLCSLFKSSLANKRYDGVAEFTAGAIAGALSITISNPIDVVKTRLQTQDYTSVTGKTNDVDSDASRRSGGRGKAGLYQNALSGIRRILQEEGITALMKGVQARMLVTALGSGTALYLYETTRRLSTPSSTATTTSTTTSTNSTSFSSSKVSLMVNKESKEHSNV